MIRNNGMRLLVGFVLGLLSSLGVAQAGQAVEGSAKADSLKSCVRDTPFMRRSHFELIKHQRTITVHEGVRKTDDALAGCVDCHVRKDAAGEYVPVTAPGEFCAGCHAYTAVTLDCFSCHSTVPNGKQGAAVQGEMSAEQFNKVHAGVPAVATVEAAQGMGN